MNDELEMLAKYEAAAAAIKALGYREVRGAAEDSSEVLKMLGGKITVHVYDDGMAIDVYSLILDGVVFHAAGVGRLATEAEMERVKSVKSATIRPYSRSITLPTAELRVWDRGAWDKVKP